MFQLSGFLAQGFRNLKGVQYLKTLDHFRPFLVPREREMDRIDGQMES